MRASRLEALRYAAAAAVILAGCGGLAFALGGSAPDEAAPEVDSAVMVELPAADSSARPESDAQDGPEQQAQAAAQATPDLPEPPQEKPPEDKPPDEKQPEEKPPEPMPPPAPVETPPAPAPRTTPTTPDAAAQVVPQAATAAQEELAPQGARAPDPNALDEGEDGRPHPSHHAITLWQRSLMKRLDEARRRFASSRHGSGTVTVAFSIDGRGLLVSRRVEKSSGVPAVDAAGLQLVQQAAPFPTPPAGSRDGDLSFVIPIRFR